MHSHGMRVALSGGQRRADALAELARRTLEAGQLPLSGGVRPQLLVTVDLDSLLNTEPRPDPATSPTSPAA
jgi:Domain of unknown function (DUF222)